jgi:hypothetical protein
LINSDTSAHPVTINTATDFVVTVDPSSTLEINMRSDGSGWLLSAGAGPTVFFGTYSTQQLNPWYAWGNSFNGATGASALPFGLSYMDAGHTTIAQPDSAVMIQEGREYYNNTAKPGYTPYQYPHPLRVPPARTRRDASRGSPPGLP